MNPGFFSYIGHLFKINTDYTKLLNYRTEYANYQQRWNTWYNNLDRSQRNVARFVHAHETKLSYERREAERKAEAKAFAEHRLGRLIMYSHGLSLHVTTHDQVAAEEAYLIEREIESMKHLTKRHLLTPQGRLQQTVNHLDQLLDKKNTPSRILRSLTGFHAERYFLEHYYHALTLEFKKYAVPEIADKESKTPNEMNEHKKKMRNVGELANFSALSDPSITGIEAKDGFTPEEAAKLNFRAILTNFYTVGSEKSLAYIKFVEPAREKGYNDLLAYHNGNPEPLATALARSLRLLNREVTSMPMTNPVHTMKTLYITNRIYGALQEHSDLREASGLTAAK